MPRRSLTSEEERIALFFTKLIAEWEIEFFEQRANTVSLTRANINQWLDDMELTFSNGMIKGNIEVGFANYGIVHGVAKIDTEIEAYLEVYRSQVLLLSQKDLTEATVLRNNLGVLLSDGKWQKVYKEFDDFSKANIGLSLQQQKKAFKNTAVWRDHISFVDTSGRTWSPEAYADMWTRTRNAEIASDVLMAEMDELDMDVIQVSIHGTITPFDKQLEGKFFSRTGATNGLPLLKFRTPYHPNCKHREIPISPQDSTSDMIKFNNKQNRSVKSFNTKLDKGAKKSITDQKKWFKENRPQES